MDLPNYNCIIRLNNDVIEVKIISKSTAEVSKGFLKKRNMGNNLLAVFGNIAGMFEAMKKHSGRNPIFSIDGKGNFVMKWKKPFVNKDELVFRLKLTPMKRNITKTDDLPLKHRTGVSINHLKNRRYS